MLLLMASWLGFAPCRAEMLTLLGLLSIGNAFFLRDPTTRLAGTCRCSWALALPLVLLITLSLPPTEEVDAIGIWGLKAKVLLHQPLRPMPDYFLDRTLSYSHLDYPLLLPMLWASIYGWVSSADGPAKLILLLPTIATGLLLFANVRLRLGATAATLLSAVAVGTPAVSRWAAQGQADTMLALFIVAAGAFLARFIEEIRPSDAVLAGLFAGFAANTKLEGQFTLALIGGMLAVTACFRRRRPGAAAGLLTLALVAAPWLIWSRSLPHTHENYAARLSLLELRQSLPRLPMLVEGIVRTVRPWNWSAMGAVLAACVISGPRALKHRAAWSLWILVAGLILADLAAYLVTPWELVQILPTTLDRLLLQLTPLLVLIAAMHWQSAVTPSPRSAVASPPNPA